MLARGTHSVAAAAVATIMAVSSIAIAQSQPPQPPSGPGGASYAHSGYSVTMRGSGSTQYWVYQPDNPKPASGPLVVFNHGYGAMQPDSYLAWLIHLARRGNVVVYPRYQATLLTPQSTYTGNAITAVKNAIAWLQASSTRVQPDLGRFAIAGHSYGGVVSVNMAHRWQSAALPQPRALMPAQPYDQFMDSLTGIPSTVLMNCLIGEDDSVVDRSGCDLIWDRTGHIPLANRDYIVMLTDPYGNPDLVADHYAPVAPLTPGQVSETDAYDYYATWKIFDALCDCAFSGNYCAYGLGDTASHRGMGLWGDGVPVEELLVLDSKP